MKVKRIGAVAVLLCTAAWGQMRKTALPCEYSGPLLRESGGVVVGVYVATEQRCEKCRSDNFKISHVSFPPEANRLAVVSAPARVGTAALYGHKRSRRLLQSNDAKLLE
jgi:hypothetical protein